MTENRELTLETSRRHPETGEWFTFRTSAGVELYEDETKLTAKECILYFLRLMYYSQKNEEAFAHFVQQAGEAIPIIETFLGEVTFKLEAENGVDFVCKLRQSIPVQTLETPDGTRLDRFDQPAPEGWSLFAKENAYPEETPYVSQKSFADYEPFFSQILDECIQMEIVHRAALYYLNVQKANPVSTDIQAISDSEKTLKEVALNEQPDNYKIVMHLSRQLFGSKYPPFRKDAAEQWSQRMGVSIDKPISRYGVDLTEIQFRVLESVLKVLTQTNYKGNLEPKTKQDLLQDFPNISSVDDLPKMFKYIDYIPRLRVGKRELVRLADMDANNQGDMNHVIQALSYLALTPFCFYYSRLAYDSAGKPIRSKKTGDWEKEDVTAFDTLLKLKIVNEQDTGTFKHFEIEPSGVFLDQHESFFMLIPAHWRQEVQAIVGSGKSTKYLYIFLLYIREQYEQKRRYNLRARVKCKYEIKTDWMDIVKTIRMPESVYKGQVERAKKILTTCLDAAQKVDYLSSVKWTGDKIILKLNPDKFYNPKLQLTDENQPEGIS